MARKHAIFLLCLISIATILAQIQASTTTLPVSGQHNKQGRVQYGVSEGSLRPQECSPRCGYRCSKTAFKKPCMFFCKKCCARCLCVPPGTYGNKQMCPCYNNWKTKRGGPKCP